jgi:hypothetical protein
MDPRLKSALESSKFMKTFQNQKRILQEKYSADLIHYYKGSQFTADPALINYLDYLHRRLQDDAMLTDDHKIPVLIDNVEQFLLDISTINARATNVYYTKYSELINSKDNKSLIDNDK